MKNFILKQVRKLAFHHLELIKCIFKQLQIINLCHLTEKYGIIDNSYKFA